MFEGVLARQANGFIDAYVPLRRALLERSYLPHPLTPTPSFSEALRAHLADGLWAESFAVAPGETARAVERALRDVMLASSTLRPDGIDLVGLDPQSRTHHHLSSLLELWGRLGDQLPEDLLHLRAILEADTEDAIEPLHVVHDPADPRLTAVERAVLETLMRHHGTPLDLEERRATLIAARDQCHGRRGSALAHLQESFLAPETGRLPLDETVRVFGLRDAAAEADFAASLAQSWLDTDPALSPADIGLLLPAGPHYATYVREAFARAGLPLSGLPAGGEQRDLAGECLLHFLTCLRQPAPPMALASLLRSALMPWSAADGRKLSDAVMAGKFSFESVVALEGSALAMARLLGNRRVPKAHEAAERLSALVRNLTTDAAFAEEATRLVELARPIQGGLFSRPAQAEVPWEELAAQVLVSPWRDEAAGPALVAGVTIYVDGEAPPRTVRHLVVLGFNEGAFPAPPPVSPLFLDSEIAAIREHCDLHLSSQEDILSARLRVLRSQFAAARESLTVLAPYRDLTGARNAPSASLVLMARCFEDVEEPESLIVDLADERWLPAGALPVAPETKSLPLPPLTVPSVLSLGADLLSLRTDEEGQALAQSPSRLETLLVSPLAWLMNEMDMVDKPWAPETLDVLTVGSLFHQLVERLFPPDTPLPAEADIRARLPDLMAEEIRTTAPFLAGGAWMVERQSMERDFTKAALSWRATLDALGARIIASELDLRGHALGVACRGFVDCLLRLPDGSLVIVDHKTSGSHSRRRRMEHGLDLQVEIYRTLAAQATAAQASAEPGLEVKALAHDGPIGVAYHTTRDGAVLLHGLQVAAPPGSVDVINADICGAATLRLKEEIARLRTGELRLTRADELTTLEKAGVGLYALETSPLVSLFIPPAPAQESEDA
ncbi:MAG: PD-(D/E)XK nuclease family protein [Pseudomonadota bacterium]